MRKKKPQDKYRKVSLSLPKGMLDRLEGEAHTQNRSLSNMVATMLIESVREMCEPYSCLKKGSTRED
jgi:hypothetical protein